MPLGLVLAYLVQSKFPKSWAGALGFCFGLFFFFASEGNFTAAASISDKAWHYTTFLMPGIASLLGSCFLHLFKQSKSA